MELKLRVRPNRSLNASSITACSTKQGCRVRHGSSERSSRQVRLVDAAKSVERRQQPCLQVKACSRLQQPHLGQHVGAGHCEAAKLGVGGHLHRAMHSGAGVAPGSVQVAASAPCGGFRNSLGTSGLGQPVMWSRFQTQPAHLQCELDAVPRLLRHRLAQREVAGVKHAVHVLHDLLVKQTQFSCWVRHCETCVWTGMEEAGRLLASDVHTPDQTATTDCLQRSHLAS